MCKIFMSYSKYRTNGNDLSYSDTLHDCQYTDEFRSRL